VETALIKTPQNYDVAQKLNCLKEKNKTNKNSKWCCTPNMFSKIYLHSSFPPPNSPSPERISFILTQYESPLLNDYLCKVWFQLVGWFCSRRLKLGDNCIVFKNSTAPIGDLMFAI
jgi:hypothetical protein